MVQARAVGADLLIIDGYEQLSRVSRLWLAWQLRRNGWGAIVTAHRDAGYPTLLRTRATAELTERIVARLLSDSTAAIDQRTIASSFAAAGGNVRETLFDLYDHFERRETPLERRAGRGADAFPAPANPGTNCPTLTIVTIA